MKRESKMRAYAGYSARRHPMRAYVGLRLEAVLRARRRHVDSESERRAKIRAAAMARGATQPALPYSAHIPRPCTKAARAYQRMRAHEARSAAVRCMRYALLRCVQMPCMPVLPHAEEEGPERRQMWGSEEGAGNMQRGGSCRRRCEQVAVHMA